MLTNEIAREIRQTFAYNRPAEKRDGFASHPIAVEDPRI